MSSIQKAQFLITKTPLTQFVRHRRCGVYMHKKPRWIGPAPSKMFVLPPMDHTPADDIEQLLALSWQHRDRMAAVSQLLYEDYLRHSDAGAAAKLEARKQMEEDEKLLHENEVENANVAKARRIRLEEEKAAQAEQVSREVQEFERLKLKKARQLEEFIEDETRALENRIRLEDLESAIERAIDNPIDYEFAIDTEGHIFRGRETKSLLVPKKERVKIQRPLLPHEKLLKIKV